MKKENAEKLYARFDFLDPKQTFMESGFGCPDEWFQLLWDLCEGIENELKKNPKLKENFRVIETKEKWGELRFYVVGENEKINELIAGAEKKSLKIRR